MVRLTSGLYSFRLPDYKVYVHFSSLPHVPHGKQTYIIVINVNARHEDFTTMNIQVVVVWVSASQPGRP
jgi:hypothetical protein